MSATNPAAKVFTVFRQSWLLLAMAAVLFWGIWAITSRFIGDAVNAAQSQALSTLGLVPVLLALAFSKKLTASSNRSLGSAQAFAAGILACGGNIAYYHALNLGEKASTVIPLTAMYPLVTIVLAMIVLRERINGIQALGIVLSFIAIYLFNMATVAGIFSSWIGYALLPVLFWGCAGLLQKISTNHISGELSTLWFLAAFIPVGIAIVWLQPVASSLSARTWWGIAALGLFFSLGNLAILGAFARGGKASIITPLTALYPAVSIPLAIILFQEKIGARESAAIALALLSVLALACETPPRPVRPAEKILANEIDR